MPRIRNRLNRRTRCALATIHKNPERVDQILAQVGDGYMVAQIEPGAYCQSYLKTVLNWAQKPKVGLIPNHWSCEVKKGTRTAYFGWLLVTVGTRQIALLIYPHEHFVSRNGSRPMPPCANPLVVDSREPDWSPLAEMIETRVLEELRRPAPERARNHRTEPCWRIPTHCW